MPETEDVDDKAEDCDIDREVTGLLESEGGGAGGGGPEGGA